MIRLNANQPYSVGRKIWGTDIRPFAQSKSDVDLETLYQIQRDDAGMFIVPSSLEDQCES